MPPTRSSASPCDVVSMTAARSPPSAIARRPACSLGAPGVVACSSFGSCVPPMRVEAVPIIPVRTPAASSAAVARNDVVVLPSVPVIPTTASPRLGSPYHHEAATATAGWRPVHDELRQRDLGERALDDGRGGTRLGRAGHEVVPVDVTAVDRDEQRSRPDAPANRR